MLPWPCCSVSSTRCWLGAANYCPGETVELLDLEDLLDVDALKWTDAEFSEGAGPERPARLASLATLMCYSMASVAYVLVLDQITSGAWKR